MSTVRLSLAAILGALALAAGCAPHEEAHAPSVTTATPPVPAAEETDKAKLIGKWLRPDGGYVLDIRGTSEDGLLDTGYFNPSPIHVAQAKWERSAELGLSIFVELRDTGYPGATYRLQYRAADDTLAGAYTQPAVGETFDVEFVRQP